MIVTRLRGGLGNQMFQYAIGRVLSIKNKAPLALDTHSLGKGTGQGNTVREYDLDVFKVIGKIATAAEVPFSFRLRDGNFLSLYRKFLGRPLASLFHTEKNVFSEASFAFDPKVLNAGSEAYLSGYWQSYLYLVGYEDVIRNDFRLKDKLSEASKKLGDEIASQNSVCVHVRRGDYVGNTFHDTVGKDYYEKALSILKEKLSVGQNASQKPHALYVFSDDIEWCKHNLHFPGHKTLFVGQEYAGRKNQEHLYLMSLCRHFIIANSSFSWWAAWLSTHGIQDASAEKIVIAPKRWFANESIDTSKLTPPSWMRI